MLENAALANQLADAAFSDPTERAARRSPLRVSMDRCDWVAAVAIVQQFWPTDQQDNAINLIRVRQEHGAGAVASSASGNRQHQSED